MMIYLAQACTWDHSSAEINGAYVEGQRLRLIKLGRICRKPATVGNWKSATWKRNLVCRRAENEDDAKKLDMLEKEGNLLSQAIEHPLEC